MLLIPPITPLAGGAAPESSFVGAAVVTAATHVVSLPAGSSANDLAILLRQSDSSTSLPGPPGVRTGWNPLGATPAADQFGVIFHSNATWRKLTSGDITQGWVSVEASANDDRSALILHVYDIQKVGGWTTIDTSVSALTGPALNPAATCCNPSGIADRPLVRAVFGHGGIANSGLANQSTQGTGLAIQLHSDVITVTGSAGSFLLDDDATGGTEEIIGMVLIPN